MASKEQKALDFFETYYPIHINKEYRKNLKILKKAIDELKSMSYQDLKIFYEARINKLDKALDIACEKLYDKGYHEQCKFKMCEVATTFYEGDYDKKICSNCHKDYMLEQAQDELESEKQ